LPNNHELRAIKEKHIADIVKINDEVFSTDDLIKYLKLNGRYEKLLEDVVKDKLAVHAAKKQGISVSVEDIQARADEFRRVMGMHRAKEMNDFLDSKGISLEELETFITETVYRDKVMDAIANDQAVEAYFKLNSPSFATVDISHIVVDSDGKAREIIAILEDEPEIFETLAREHSLADAEKGGHVGKINRGGMQASVEAKVFNASQGDILGPFVVADGSFYEIITVNARRNPQLDAETVNQIRQLIKDQWFLKLVRENRVETLT